MKEIWIRINKWDKKIVLAAIEGGARGLLLPKGVSKLASKLGRIRTISEDGDLRLGEDVVFYKFSSPKDENKVVELSKNKIVILEFNDWKIIPLENIIAKGGNKIIVSVKSLEEAKLFFYVLEKGVMGVLINGDDAFKLKKELSKLTFFKKEIDLKIATIKSIKYIGLGDRVCVDTCTLMTLGEGILVGNTSSFFFLIHSESIKNFYVEPRSFRINAGAVHAYAKISENKTVYLSELVSGDNVLMVNNLGGVKPCVVGRIKIERRPLLLIQAIYNDYFGSIIVQNAETIRLVSPNGNAKSVVDLKSGDKILVNVDIPGRHFGLRVKEYIQER